MCPCPVNRQTVLAIYFSIAYQHQHTYYYIMFERSKSNMHVHSVASNMKLSTPEGMLPPSVCCLYP